MPVTNEAEWNDFVAKNDDPYGGACVKVAEKVMELLDDDDHGEFDTHAIICEADKASDAGGITGFMAGAVAHMVGKCHSRGEEFRLKWNTDNQIGTEGDKANDSGGTLNPAVLEVG